MRQARSLYLGTAPGKEPVIQAADQAVVRFVGFDTFNHNPLELRPQALF